MLQPKIVYADRIAAFRLPGDYVATLLGNIYSQGLIEYHHILIIFGPDQEICLFTASEWSNLDPGYKSRPVFGVFHKDGHYNMGGSPDWLDPGLFVLHSVEYVKERFRIPDDELSEAEAWALTRILKQIQELSGEKDLPQHAPLWTALRNNNARMVAYMKRGTADSQGDLESNTQH